MKLDIRRIGWVSVERHEMEDPATRALLFRYVLPTEVRFDARMQEFIVTGSSSLFRSLGMGDEPPRYEVLRNTDDGGVDTLTFQEVS